MTGIFVGTTWSLWRLECLHRNCIWRPPGGKQGKQLLRIGAYYGHIRGAIVDHKEQKSPAGERKRRRPVAYMGGHGEGKTLAVVNGVNRHILRMEVGHIEQGIVARNQPAHRIVRSEEHTSELQS